MDISLKHASLLIKDATSSSTGTTIRFGDGNFTWTNAKQYDYILERGKLDTVREGDDVPCNVSFDGRWEHWTGDDPESILTNNYGAGTHESVATDPCEPYACTLELEVAQTCGEAKTGSKWTFKDFRYESVAFDVSAGTISVSGQCNILAPTKAAVTGA